MRRTIAAPVIAALSLLGSGLVAGSVSAAPTQQEAAAVCTPLGQLIDNARKAPFGDAEYAKQLATASSLLAELEPLADDELSALLGDLESLTADLDGAIVEAGGVANLTAEQRTDFRDRANSVLAPLADYDVRSCSPDISDITIIYNEDPCPTSTDPAPGPTLTITNARTSGDAEVAHSQTLVTVPAQTELVVSDSVESQQSAAFIAVDGVVLPDGQFTEVQAACVPPTSTSPPSGDDAPPSDAQPAPLSPRFTG